MTVSLKRINCSTLILFVGPDKGRLMFAVDLPDYYFAATVFFEVAADFGDLALAPTFLGFGALGLLVGDLNSFFVLGLFGSAVLVFKLFERAFVIIGSFGCTRFAVLTFFTVAADAFFVTCAKRSDISNYKLAQTNTDLTMCK